MNQTEEKRISIWKIVAISAGVAVLVAAAVVILCKVFRKYFRISIDCGDCDDCTQDCFGCEFDPLCECDEDFVPRCDADADDEDDAPEPDAETAEVAEDAPAEE